MAVAECIEAPRRIVRRTVAAGTAIPKGTLMKFSGTPNTAAAATAQNDEFAGITVEEKVSTETDVLEVGCAIDGVWKIDTTAAGINKGVPVQIATGSNVVIVSADADFEQGSIVGIAEETRDGDNRIRVRLMGH